MKNLTAIISVFVRCYHSKGSYIKIYKYLNYNDINEQFFTEYNSYTEDIKLVALKGVAFILAVKKL